MAIPATGYDSATITNPSSALTDFTLIVDLSRMSASWWSGVNTSDGTRGRAAKNDGTTELACDWIDFDDTGETGLLRVKYTGSLASSGTQIIRIYPPNTGNAAYGVSDTYGQYNAYDSGVWAYYPLHDDQDRTTNNRDLTGQGSLAFGGGTGLIGDATQFTQSSDQHAETTSQTFDFVTVMTYSCLVNFDSEASDQGIFSPEESVTNFDRLQAWRDEYASGDRIAVFNGQAVGYGSTTLSTAQWYGFAYSTDATNVSNIRLDSSAEATTGEPTTIGAGDLNIGSIGNGKYLDGLQQHAMFSNVERTIAWQDEEIDQLSDNPTFWGTWSWTSPGGGISIPVVMNQLRNQGAY